MLVIIGVMSLIVVWSTPELWYTRGEKLCYGGRDHRYSCRTQLQGIKATGTLLEGKSNAKR